MLGAVAASGGYYLAAGARRIVAAPGTITGSIGVVTGKLVLTDLYRRWGLNAEQLQRGRFALLTHPSRPLDAEERALLERSNQEAYQRFVSCVAAGRRMSSERVNELGRGRIWSGADAHGCGLVDELGDVRRGIELAAELGGIPPKAAAWNARAPAELLLPSSDDPTTLGRALGSLLRERTLAIHPALVSVV
jgi:protease-4